MEQQQQQQQQEEAKERKKRPMSKRHAAKGLVIRSGEVEMFMGETVLRTHPAFDVVAQLPGSLLLTTFRLLFLPDASQQWYGGVQRVPLGCIFRVKAFDRRDRSNKAAQAIKAPPAGFHLIICLKCKDFREVVFALDTREDRHVKFHEALLKRAFPSNVKELFAFSFRPPWEKVAQRWSLYDPLEEFQRQGVLNPCSQWRLSRVNEDFSLCPTYPKMLVVPKSIDDEVLRKVAEFRSRGRIPVLSYKHVNQASITRSAQPMVGLTGSRSAADEGLLEAIFLANPHGGKLQVLDARPKVNAVANTAAGAGYETPKQYPFIELPQFLGLPNIHVCRDACKKLRALCRRPDDLKWGANLDATGWLDLVRLLLQSSITMVELVDKQSASVLCHCSDGWDRTSQLVSLSMIMLDQYYRSLRGFMVLLEKEWISFGHKFGERTGHGLPNYSHDQRGPIFLQFIDACLQLLQQFPTSFQFNSNLLIFLLDALYSCQFGNFLCDSDKEREEACTQQETTSIWTYIVLNQSEFLNVFYRPNPHVLFPNCSRARIVFWSEYYLRWNSARPQYLVEQQHLIPAGEAYQLFIAPSRTASQRPAEEGCSTTPGGMTGALAEDEQQELPEVAYLQIMED